MEVVEKRCRQLLSVGAREAARAVEAAVGREKAEALRRTGKRHARTDLCVATHTQTPQHVHVENANTRDIDGRAPLKSGAGQHSVQQV